MASLLSHVTLGGGFDGLLACFIGSNPSNVMQNIDRLARRSPQRLCRCAPLHDELILLALSGAVKSCGARRTETVELAWDGIGGQIEVALEIERTALGATGQDPKF